MIHNSDFYYGHVKNLKLNIFMHTLWLIANFASYVHKATATATGWVTLVINRANRLSVASVNNISLLCKIVKRTYNYLVNELQSQTK